MESACWRFLPWHLRCKIGQRHWGIWRKEAEFSTGVIHIIIGPGFIWTHSGSQGFHKIMGLVLQICLDYQKSLSLVEESENYRVTVQSATPIKLNLPHVVIMSSVLS